MEDDGMGENRLLLLLDAGEAEITAAASGFILDEQWWRNVETKVPEQQPGQQVPTILLLDCSAVYLLLTRRETAAQCATSVCE